jgi:hypothetical protein
MFPLVLGDVSHKFDTLNVMKCIKFPEMIGVGLFCGSDYGLGFRVYGYGACCALNSRVVMSVQSPTYKERNLVEKAQVLSQVIPAFLHVH